MGEIALESFYTFIVKGSIRFCEKSNVFLKGIDMQIRINRIGSIVALGSGVLSLVAFFGMVWVQAWVFSLTMPQIISTLDGFHASVAGQTPDVLWVGALLPLLVCLLSLVPLLSKGKMIQVTQQAYPMFYQGNYPQIYYKYKMSEISLLASLAFTLCAIATVALSIWIYTSIGTYNHLSTAFLSNGFWVYAFGGGISCIGGFIQMSAYER